MAFYECVQNNITTKVHMSNSEKCHDFQKDILNQRTALPPGGTQNEKKIIIFSF